MKHVKRYFLLLAVICGVGLLLTRPQIRHLAGQASESLKAYYVEAHADAVNQEGFSLSMDGVNIDTKNMQMSSQMHLLMPLAEAVDCFKTSITIGEKGEGLVGGRYFEDIVVIPEERTQDTVLIDITEAADALGVDYTWEDGGYQAILSSLNHEVLPENYDSRAILSLNEVESQGTFGTCWAFAATAALEASLPNEVLDFSVDHMTMNSGFNISPTEGGDYNMSLAYLASWKGPVLEYDDPYGDGMTDESLAAVKHLQEARRIDEKNLDEIKSMVMNYGAVESSLYMSIENEWDVSDDYEPENAAYYYSGDMTPNHDIVIVGWDDHYSRENFNQLPERDGAFVCRNSWGSDFGMDGYFYVSYEDSNLGTGSMAYTRLDNTDNYDKIYQSDLLGWVGTLGYKSESAWFASIYSAEQNETLKALSFYAVDDHTSYDIYTVMNYSESEDLNRAVYMGSGYLENGGYYTVDIPQGLPAEAGSRFAVMVNIKTEGSERPIAIEYQASDLTSGADISDGEGYVSYDGKNWVSAESEYACNICLKAFTNQEENSNG